MKRPNPCFVCGKTETSIAFSLDPWCSDDCHKKMAFLLSIPQWELKANEFDSAMRRLAGITYKAFSRKRDRVKLLQRLNITDLMKEIYRGRNGVEVYGSEDLLREAERPGDWRDSGLRTTLAGWIM